MIEVHAAEKVAATATYTSGAAAVLLGWTANEIAAITAAVICVLSYLTTQAINMYFKRQHLLLEQTRVHQMLEIAARNTLMTLPTLTCETCPNRPQHEDA